MDIHVRRLGASNILFGVLSLLITLVLFLIYGGPLGLYHSTDDTIVGLLITGSAVFHLLLAVPCIVGGFYLRYLAEWSRGLVIVTSALNILNVPFGSALGCYGLWVLLTPETDPLFSHALHLAAKKAQAHLDQHNKSSATTTTIVPSPRS